MNQMTRLAAAEPASFKARFTTAEFVPIARAGDELNIDLELIDGGLERMSPPMGNHVEMQTSVIVALARAVEGTSFKAGVEVGIELDDENVVTCDAALLTAPFERRYFKPEESALVVEVADATISRDQGIKRAKYAGAGIAEYWVVDIARSVVHRYREPVDGEYVQVDTIRFGQALAVPGTDATIILS